MRALYKRMQANPGLTQTKAAQPFTRCWGQAHKFGSASAQAWVDSECGEGPQEWDAAREGPNRLGLLGPLARDGARGRRSRTQCWVEG